MNLHGENAQWVYHCRSVEEISNRRKGDVPNYLPGENPFMAEFPNRYKLPAEAAMGGAETMYPEYRKNMKRSDERRGGKGPRGDRGRRRQRWWKPSKCKATFT